MVRWQNQEGSGFATPSSSDDEVENESPEKVSKIEYSLHNVEVIEYSPHNDKYQYPIEKHTSSYFRSFGSKIDLNVEADPLNNPVRGDNTQIRQKYGWGGERTGCGVAADVAKQVPYLDAFSPCHFSKSNKNGVKNDQRFEAGADNWKSNSQISNSCWSSKWYRPSLAGTRENESAWAKPDSGLDDQRLSVPATPDVTRDEYRPLESFLPNNLLSPEKPKHTSTQPPSTPPNFRYLNGSRCYQDILFSPPQISDHDNTQPFSKPRKWFSAVPLLHEDYCLEEQLAKDKRLSSEKQDEPWSQLDYRPTNVDLRDQLPGPDTLSLDNWYGYGNNCSLYHEPIFQE